MAAAQFLVGNYVIDRELGRGGMGVVYAATHRVLGNPAAIKILADKGQDVERFFNEGRAAMAIQHPGIVRVFDIGRASDGRAYIAMELLAGDALSAKLARGPLPVRVAVEYARQIAEALAAAHALEIIHRDLKPENVIVVGERVKLVDFGVAKLAGSLAGVVKTVSGALIGTPIYMSPEQCEGTREVDARSDLYSLGCVLFAMLVGRPPFTSTGLGALIGMHMHEPPPPLRTHCNEASPALAGLVARLLAKSPADRYQSARELAVALADPAMLELAGKLGAATTAWNLDAVANVGTTADLPGSPRPSETPGAPPSTRTKSDTPIPPWRNGNVESADPTTDRRDGHAEPADADTRRREGGLESADATTRRRDADVPTARPARGRSIVVAGMALVAIALAAVAIAIASSRSQDDVVEVRAPSPDAAPAPPQKPIVVTPPDAAIVMVAITLDGAPADTELRVDGNLFGTAPTVSIPKGTHEVTLVLSRDGYRARSIKIVPDRDRHVEAKLVPHSRPVAPESDQPTNDILKFPKP